MPIYEYRCEGCTKVFEVFQRHTDPPPSQHDCGGTRITRLLSNTSFVLKGSGWYVTDYGKGGRGNSGGEARGGGGKQGDAEASAGQKTQAPTSEGAAKGGGDSGGGSTGGGGSSGGDGGSPQAAAGGGRRGAAPES